MTSWPAAERGAAVSRDSLAIVLLDFDNAFPPMEGLTASSLRHGLLACVRTAMSVAPAVDRVRVRLYGGWMSEGILSRRGSEVATLLDEADPFPLSTADGLTVRGSLELATGIMEEPGMVLEDTYRRRGSIPRLRLMNSPLPIGCAADVASCPAKILERFTKHHRKNCPAATCGVTATEAFSVHEQKMVDTLLTCDLLAAVQDQECSAVLVVSGDTDFVPPLLYARTRSTIPVCWVLPDACESENVVALLESRGVTVVHAFSREVA